MDTMALPTLTTAPYSPMFMGNTTMPTPIPMAVIAMARGLLMLMLLLLPMLLPSLQLMPMLTMDMDTDTDIGTLAMDIVMDTPIVDSTAPPTPMVATTDTM